MNRPLRRVISATLALSLSVTLAVNAYAEEIAKVHKHEAVSAEAVATKEKSEKAKKPEKTPITKDNLPEVLDFERVKGQGFVSRFKSEEQDMCEIVLENEDGTRGLYVFDSPVKFKNKNGETVDKSNKVKPHTKNGAPCFKSESNDIEVHLPATIQAGVSLKDEEVNVSMKPIPSVASKRALSVGKQKDEDSVTYEDVFDNFTDIVYTFTYDGVKEDIVLEKYNGKNTFDFEVITGGLSLEEEKGALLLKDENGEVKATMGEIVIFSADNKNNTFGKYKITEKKKNHSYILTLCVDAAYLTSPDTKYPVTIDPTISSAHNKCGMQDMQVFKGVDGTGTTETSAGRSGVSRVGWTDWGVCRTLVNFKSDLLTSNNIKYSNQIIEASIEIRDLMCQSQSTTIYCYQFNGLSSWSDTDTKTWNQLQADKLGITADKKTVSATSGSLPSKSLGNPSTDTWNLWHKFNLTNVVKNWAGSSSLISKGLIFKAESAKETATKAAYMKTFSSMEGNENYKPYFFIRYNSYTPVTNVRFSISSLTLEEKETYTFHPIVTPSTATNQEFTWTSSNKNVATVSSSGKVTAKAAGTTVITVKSKANTNATATCKVTVKEKDSDGDGLSDTIEKQLGTNQYSKDTDGDGYDDYYEKYKSKTDPLKSDVYIYELSSEYTSIVGKNGEKYFGGNQSWSENYNRPYNYKNDLSNKGCGVIASCDVLLYLQKTNSDLAFADINFNKDGTIEINDYLDFVEHYYSLYRGTFLGGVADGALSSWNRTTAKVLDTYIYSSDTPNYLVYLVDSKQCANVLFKNAPSHEWLDDTHRGFISSICISLNNDIPFILSTTNFIEVDNGINMYRELLNGTNEYRNKLNNLHTDQSLREHAVTITKVIDDYVKKDVFIEISSWGQKFYISFKEVTEKAPELFDLYGIYIYPKLYVYEK